MGLSYEIGNDIALTILVEQRRQENLDPNEILNLIGRLTAELERISVLYSATDENAHLEFPRRPTSH